MKAAATRLLGLPQRVLARAAIRVLKSRAILPFLGTVKRVETTEPLVALTFDDGPDPRFTPLLLDVLKKHDARGTFFMIGKNADQYPWVVKQVALAGHSVANHSWDHPRFPSIGSFERRRQIRACSQAIQPFGERMFRPPGGVQTLRSRLDALLLGYEVVTWDVMAGDWLEEGYEADRIARTVRDQLSPGSIVLLHDALWDPESAKVADRTPLLDAVSLLLASLEGRYRFVTLPELLAAGPAARRLSRSPY